MPLAFFALLIILVVAYGFWDTLLGILGAIILIPVVIILGAISLVVVVALMIGSSDRRS